MPSRAIIARLSTAAVLSAVLIAVLQQANTHADLYGQLRGQGAFGGVASAAIASAVTTSTTTTVYCCYSGNNASNCMAASSCGAGAVATYVDELSCNDSCNTDVSSSTEPWYICNCGGCVSSDSAPAHGMGTPTHDPSCGGVCGETAYIAPECGLKYCCYEEGNINNCVGVGACSPGAVGEYADDLSCMDSCNTTPSSVSSSEQLYCCSAAGGGCIAQAGVGDANCDGDKNGYTEATCNNDCDTTRYCCAAGVPAATNCQPYTPCGAVGAACGGAGQPGCCAGSFCDTDSTCTAGTPE